MTSSLLLSVFAAAVLLLVVYYLSRLRHRPTPRPKRYRFKEKYIDVLDLRICYVEKGPKNLLRRNRSIIFLHGLGGFLDNWDENLPYFSGRYRAIALDLPGFGKSEKPIMPYSVQFFTNVVKAFMDARGITRAVLVGNSMGGHIALNVALKYPEMVEKLVLVDPGGSWRKPGTFLSLVIALFGSDWWFRHPSPWQIRLVVSRIFYDAESRHAREYMRRYIGWSRTKEFHLFAHAFYRAGVDILFNTLRNRLREVRVPTLIVWGKEDRIIPVGLAYSMHRRIRGSRLIVYERCGHVPMMEKAAEFNRDVEKFLEARR